MADLAPRIVLTGVDRSGAAFASARRNLESLNAAASGIAARFGSIGLAIGAAFEAASFKNVFDTADALGKLSQRSGVAIEDLSALRFAGKLADVSFEDLDTSLKKLNLNIAAGARGEKEQAEAFRAIGVATKDAAGNVRSADQVLGDIADRFQQYEDGANKVALANALGGKSFEKLIPLLNGGRAGIQAAREELDKLGGVFTPEFAKRAEEFNDNLTRIGAAGEALKIRLGGPLIEKLAQLSAAFVKAQQDGTLLLDLLKAIAGFSPTGSLFGALFKGLGSQDNGLEAAEREAQRLQNLITGVESTLKRDPENPRQLKYLDTLRGKLAAVNAQLDALKAGPPAERVTRTLGGINAPPVKKQAPGLPSGSAGSAPDLVAGLRAQLQLREQAIDQSLADELDQIRFTEGFIEQVYRSGNTSLETSFRAQDELRRRNVDEVRRATAEKVAAEQAFQAALPAPKDAAAAERNKTEVTGSEARIQAARAKLAAAERELAQATSLSALQRPEQREALQQEVGRFEAALQELVDGGRSRAVELQDIAVKTRAAEKLLIEGGADPQAAAQRAQQFAAQLELQRQFNLARDDFARITDRARDAEEALAIAQRAGGTGLVEGERELAALREREIAQLDQLIERTRALAAAAPANDQISDELRRLELAAARLREIRDPTKVRADAAADNIGDAIANGLSRANTEGRKLKDTIKAIGLNVFDIFEREVITKPLAQQLANLIKGSGADGGNILTDIFKRGGATGQGTPAFSLDNVLGAPPAAGVSGLVGAGPLTGAGESGGVPANPFGDIFGKAAQSVAGLGSASAGSAAVLGKLPDLAAIPATTALGALTVAAQAAAAALLQIGTSSLANGLAGSSGIGSLGLGGLIGGGGGFGSGANFGNLDLGLFLHDGGVAGTGGEARPLPAGAFARAVRYHTGGVSGHAADPAGRVEAVLQAGEELIPPGDPRHRDSATPMQQLIAKGGIIVQRLGTPVPGLAPDEVPALLPRGMEVLTAADPRHRNNLGAAPAQTSAAAFDTALGLAALPGQAGAVWQAALEAGPHGRAPAAGADPLADLERLHAAPRFHDGGVIGGAAWAGFSGVTAASEPAAGGRGGDHSVHVDLRGLTVQSHGQMDRMAEDRSAARIAAKAQRYLQRRGA